VYRINKLEKRPRSNKRAIEPKIVMMMMMMMIIIIIIIIMVKGKAVRILNKLSTTL
jgi:hypothetical protein